MGTVTFDGTRIDPADVIGNWDILDTSSKASINEDLFYQGVASISRKISSGVGGNEYEHASTVDYTSPKRVMLFKDLVTTVAIIGDLGPNGLNNRIGSSESNFWAYLVHGPISYPPGRSWIDIPIDPNVAAWRDLTVGTPVITAIDYYAIQCGISGSARDDNVAIDALDYMTHGTGLTVTGTGSVYQDFIDEDEGDVDNRWHIVSSRSGIIYCNATLTIGNLTETAFADVNKVVVFEPGLIDAGHLGLVLGRGHASSAISTTACTYVGTGVSGVKHYFGNIDALNVTDDVITIPSHGYNRGDPIQYSLEGGSNAIGPLSDDQIVYAIPITVDTFAIAPDRLVGIDGDIHMTLASATNFSIGGPITGDGDGGNTGVGRVLRIAGDDVFVKTISGAWVSGNGVDNADPFSSDDTTISAIVTTNGGGALTVGASRENHSFKRLPDTRFDVSVTISMTVASASSFEVGGPITGDGDNGNDGQGVVRGISGSVLEVQTVSGSWVATNGVDNAFPYSADATTISSFVDSGDVDVIGGSLINCRRITLYPGTDLSADIIGVGQIFPNGGTLTGNSISEQTTEEGEALIDVDDLDILNTIDITAGLNGHFVRMTTASSEGWDHTLSGFWEPADDGWEFLTSQAFTSEQVNMSANHGFVDGEAVWYNKEGGTAAIGLTDDDKVYVGVVDADTVTLHLTSASALLGTNAINLTTNGAETHSLYSGRAALHNDTSSGTLTVNVTAGTAPSVRNSPGAATTVVSGISLTFTPLQTNTEVRLYETGTNIQIDGIENSGASFVASAGVSQALDYKIIKPGFLDIIVKNVSFAASQNIIVNQKVDPNFIEDAP